jgi:transcription termination factor Rho
MLTKKEIIEEYEKIYERIDKKTTHKVRNNRGIAEIEPSNDSVKIFNWICPIKLGSTTVLSAQAGAGKTFLMEGLFASIKGMDDKIIYQVGEGFRDEDPEFTGAEVYSDPMPKGSSQVSINIINQLLDYIEDCINLGDKILFGIDSITRIITRISSAIPSNGNASSGGLTSESYDLMMKLMSLAGTYDTGAQITFIGTCLDGSDSAGKMIIEAMDSLAGAIVPLKKPEGTRAALNGSPSFDFKSKNFSFREIGGSSIAERWQSLASDFKSRPSEFICSKIKERM